MESNHESYIRLLAEQARALSPDIRQWRSRLHCHPELSGQENDTMAFVCKQLDRLGIPWQRIEHGGLAATLCGRRKTGRRLVLRADMDALPVAESDRNLAGPKQAVSQVEGVSHACGHDAHSAMLLGALTLLQNCRDAWDGEIIALFEQGEETGYGVFALLRHLTRAYDGIDGCFALHVYAGLPQGTISLQPGYRMSGAVSYDVTLTGHGGHASRPDLCRNPIDCFVSICNDLTGLRMRCIDPNECLTHAVSLVQAGSSSNIIPGSLRFAGTVRFLNAETSGLPFRQALKDTVEKNAALYGCQARFQRLSGAIPGVLNDECCSELAQQTAADLFGPDWLANTPAWMASESYSLYSVLFPSVLGLLGIANDSGCGAPHHSPEFDLDGDLLYRGSACAAAYARAFLAPEFTPPPRRDSAALLAQWAERLK